MYDTEQVKSLEAEDLDHKVENHRVEGLLQEFKCQKVVDTDQVKGREAEDPDHEVKDHKVDNLLQEVKDARVENLF